MSDILYMVLVGGSSLVVMIAGSYVFAIGLDRFCSSPYSTERIFSRVSNQADIWGMELNEREKVLERIFANKGTVRTFRKDGTEKNSLDAQDGVEMVEIGPSKKSGVDHSTIEMNGTALEDQNKTSLVTDDPNSDTSIEDKDDDLVDENMAHAMEIARELPPGRLDSMCSICLVEYGKVALRILYL